MSHEPRGAGHDTHELMLTWVSLVHAGSYLPVAVSHHLQEELGISLAEQDLLKQLGRAGGELTLGELSRQIYLSKAGITKMMDRLQAAGFVERVRSDEDRRVIYARLTADGTRVLGLSKNALVAWVRANVGEHLSGRQLASLRSALKSLLRAHDRWKGQMEHLKGAPRTRD